MFTQYDDNGNVQMVQEPSPEYNYTYADYLKWQWEERVELIKGIVMQKPAPNTRHQTLSGNFYFILKGFLNTFPGKVFHAPFDVRLPVRNKKRDDEINTVVQPDLCIVCDHFKIDERGCCGAPDIIIEILSPGNSKREIKNKFELYEEAGVLEYWIVAPAEEFVTIWYLENGRYTRSKPFAGDQIITSRILPGLEINTTDIFKQ